MKGFNIEIKDIDNLTMQEYDLCFSVVKAFQRQSKIAFDKSTSEINSLNMNRMTKIEFLNFLDYKYRKVEGNQFVRLYKGLKEVNFTFLDEIDLGLLYGLRNCNKVTYIYFESALKYLKQLTETKDIETNKCFDYLFQ